MESKVWDTRHNNLIGELCLFPVLEELIVVYHPVRNAEYEGPLMIVEQDSEEKMEGSPIDVPRASYGTITQVLSLMPGLLLMKSSAYGSDVVRLFREWQV